MLFRLRALLVGLVSLALSAAIALAPSPAEARPMPPAPGHHAGKIIVSAAVARYAGLAASVRKKTKAKTVDYRVATSVFKRDKKYGTTWRRAFAAGWLIRNGRISHISSTELGKVRTVIRSTFRRMEPNCRGETKYTYYKFRDRPHWNYYNSCDTNLLIRNYGFCTLVGGIIAMAGGSAGAAIGGIIAAVCGGIITWITAAQANSSVSAIIVSVGNTAAYKPTPNTPQDPSRYQVPVAVDPQ